MIGWTGHYAEEPQLLRELKTDAGVCGLAVLKDVLYVTFFKKSVIRMFDAGKPVTFVVTYLYLWLAASVISQFLGQERNKSDQWQTCNLIKSGLRMLHTLQTDLSAAEV